MIRHLQWATGLLLLMGLAGCNWIGTAANVVGGTDHPHDPDPTRYEGLEKQVCGIMVWADRGISTDFITVRRDLGEALESKLVQEGQGTLNASELKGATFPFPAKSLVRFQDEHPEIRFQPITEAVLRLKIDGLSRVIYLEVTRLETRYPQSRELYRGSAEAKLRVIEIKDGQSAKVTFEDTVEVKYPQTGPEALPPSDDVDDQRIYKGTIAVLAHQIARRFYVPE